jgi:deazaflavin-dependent oxidoreductase (nitroreductase family)
LNEIESLAREQFCYLTTTGRRSGNPHTIEIWFAISEDGGTLYMLSGGGERSDWVKNILHDPGVKVRIDQKIYDGRGRIVQDHNEDQLARRLVVAKYYGRDKVAATGWEATALPVAIDLG